MALIRFYKPALYRKDMDAVLQTMVDEKIGPGERKKEFLKAFAAYTGKKDGIALRSYLDAIIASLRALGLEEGDSVLVSVLTPRIYLEAFRRTGVKPVLIDSDEAGQKATIRAIEIINSVGGHSRVIKLKGAKDPDEYIKANGVNNKILN